MRALKIITGHVTYKPACTYKFQLKTTTAVAAALSLVCVHYSPVLKDDVVGILKI